MSTSILSIFVVQFSGSSIEYARWGNRNPTECGHFRVEHDEIESLVLDYLVDVAPQIKSLLDATVANDIETAKPLLDALSETNNKLELTLREMGLFTEKHLPRHPNADETISVENLYDALYNRVKPKLEKAISEKEAELEALLDGFAGLSPKLKDRANQRGETIQNEIDAFKQDLVDLRIPLEQLRIDLIARQEALERTTATLNQEGHFRQKAEALKTVIDRITCRFSRKGKHSCLKSIDLYASEDGAVRPLTFPGSLQMNSHVRVFVIKYCHI